MTAERSARKCLSTEVIVDAALALVDTEGLDRLSMRRLGGRLGVEAMTIYHYVPSKDALLDLLLGRIVIAAVPQDAEAAHWKEWLAGFAARYRTALLRHPALLPLVAVRPIRSAAAMRQLAEGVAALHQSGFTATQALHLLNVVGMFVIGHALAEVGQPPRSLVMAPQDDDAVAVLGDADGAGRQHDAIFAFGIGAILNGAADLTASRA